MSKSALISLSDKSGAEEFARSLFGLGYRIISTGGTAKLLRNAGIEVTMIDDVTGFPECLDGRLKTLHPAVHGGLLARRDRPQHMDRLAELGIETIDLVAVNLYPFKQTVLRTDATMDDVIENIDIGGPAMLRSAAKNHASVYVVTDSRDYGRVIDAIASGDERAEKSLRFELAAKAYAHTASYDAMIAQFLCANADRAAELDRVTLTYERESRLRYGENAHQRAEYFVEPFSFDGRYEQLWGKELSYNNINDLSAAVRIVSEFERPAVVAVKHASPCGAAIGYDVLDAYSKAYATDPLSIFGGIVAFNREVDLPTARRLSEIFLEVVYAPRFEPEALEVLRGKKNIRLLVPREGARGVNPNYRLPEPVSLTKTIGGVLVQTEDVMESRADYRVVTDRIPTDREVEDMEFAMRICRGAKSNAIVLAFNGQCVGIGQGQVSRVFAAENAVGHAALSVKGTVLASDAFFPFEDALEVAIKAGITAVIQPGGSVADDRIIELCNRFGIAMILTGRRHFKHGY